MTPLSRRIRLALKLLFPAPRDLRYAAKMRRSGLFDRQFYLSTNPSLHWLARALPERHYIQKGEAMGLRPNPDFAPLAYLRYNSDLAGIVRQPLLHYIDHGRHEQRVTKPMPLAEELYAHPLPVLRAGQDMRPAAPFAIVVHLYYHELWDEMAAYIRRQTFDFDLFVSVVRFREESELPDRIRAEFPDARVFEIPNHGRDIFPFVHLVNSGLLGSYRAVCKIHTKKSPHREDGDHWRNHLIDGILGQPDQTRARLDRFLQRRDAAFWVADGQFFNDIKWWGSNAANTRALLARLELPMDDGQLSFPAGSMYWMKPLMIDMIRGMRLTYGDFATEQAQVDGTPAHAMERALGYLAKAARQTVLQSTELDRDVAAPKGTGPEFVSAFYLPQFHPVPDNDRWWGKGFTEWHGVTRAAPAFPGHGQPALPSDLGFYDLRVPETLADQTRMARAAGIDAFCVYHYWFDGRRILERPMDMVLATPDLDFPFYLCWANESWRRNWDGLSGEVLLDQSYRHGFATELARDAAPYLRDPRYARPDGRRPRFVIYRPDDMPDPVANVAEMRRAWSDCGLGEVELGAVRFHIKGTNPVPDDLFDFWVEMPPHGSVGEDDYLYGGRDGNRLGFDPVPGFTGLVYDYQAIAATALTTAHRRRMPAHTIAGVMPSWDNTARRGLNAHIAYGANPATFAGWLDGMARHRIQASYRSELFINSWNEWAERAMVEPSMQYGDANLRVLAEFRAAYPKAQGRG